MWNDWDAIDAAQAKLEVERLLEEARSPQPVAQPVPAPIEPRMVRADPEYGPPEYGEPHWAAGGRYVRSVTRRKPNGSTWTEWETLPAPPVDPERGEYLAAKRLRAMGDAGLRILRETLGKGRNAND